VLIQPRLTRASDRPKNPFSPLIFSFFRMASLPPDRSRGADWY